MKGRLTLRNEFKEIEKHLNENGWTLSVPATEGEMTEYVKKYDDNVIGIEIALEPCSLDCYGRYGVCCVQIVKFETDMPYIRSDLARMYELIYRAELDLIKIGVPFRPTYGFGKSTEYLLGKNLDLREKYHLEQYEREDR